MQQARRVLLRLLAERVRRCGNCDGYSFAQSTRLCMHDRRVGSESLLALRGVNVIVLGEGGAVVRECAMEDVSV